MIEVLSSIGMKAALEKIGPAGCRIEYTTGAAVERRIEGGAPFDVALLFPAMLERLARQQKIAAGSIRPVAKSWLSAAVRAGAAAPDLSSVPALVAALRSAGSIAYSREGQSGVLMAEVIECLGLTRELAAKTIRETRAGGAAFNLGEGRAELAQCVTFAAGLSPRADAGAAEEFLALLRTPAAARAYASSGLEQP